MGQLIGPASLQARNCDLYFGGRSSNFGNSNSSKYYMILVLVGQALPRQHSISAVISADGLQPAAWTWHAFLLPPPACTPWGLDRAHSPQRPHKEDFVNCRFMVMMRRYYLFWNSCFRRGRNSCRQKHFQEGHPGPKAIGDVAWRRKARTDEEGPGFKSSSSIRTLGLDRSFRPSVSS